MISNKKILGLITARSGSKGLPKKNIKPLLGKPLIAWSIDVGIKSNYIDDLVVSTDCHEMSRLAKKYEAEAPFIRPKELSTDSASSVDVILHAINWLEKRDRFYDLVVLLEPTSPLRESKDIDRCLEIMQENNVRSIVSICKVESTHPMFLFRLNEKSKLDPYSGKTPNSLRRQDLETLYFLEGSVYCSEIDLLRTKRGFYHEETYGYIVPKWKSLEIDDEDDFLMVEALMKSRILKYE